MKITAVMPTKPICTAKIINQESISENLLIIKMKRKQYNGAVAKLQYIALDERYMSFNKDPADDSRI